jgi:Fe-S oxidoreductase
MQRCSQGRIDAAYRTYEEAVLFPEIVAALCPAPCEQACVRKDIDEPIRLPALERSLCKLAKRRPAKLYNLPKKDTSVAVIGAELDGLAIALRLAQRRYQVTIYEPSNQLGGRLSDYLAREVFLPAIEAPFAVTDCRFEFNYEFGSIPRADAVFVSTRFRDKVHPSPHVFFGTEDEPVLALAEGISLVNIIEGFLKTGIVSSRGNNPLVDNKPDKAAFKSLPIPKLEQGLFTEENLRAEADRCALCDCDSCYRRCALMRFYRHFPKPMMRAVSMTVTPTDLVQKHAAMRLVASCSQCGACKNACPLDLDPQSLIMDARRALVRRGDMPPVFRAFWLADMAHADQQGITRLSPSGNKASLAFFPGCQLGASDPRYVTETYRRLLSYDPNCALMLSCCGAPVYWAGAEEESAEKVARLTSNWKRLGKPTLVTACPTCVKMLSKALPEASTIPLYSLPLGKTAVRGAGRTVSVFDPCAGRNDTASQDAIRQLLIDADYTLVALPYEKTDAQCCGWGGQYEIANPELSQSVSTACESLSEHPYITWCTNCRDTFAADGKEAWHVLDLLLGINEQQRKPPTVSQRRINRETLSQSLLSGFWKEETAPAQPSGSLRIDDELARRISDEWILETDLEDTIAECESSGMRFYDEGEGAFIGYRQLEATTLWVVYTPEANGYHVLNAYTHRMNARANKEGSR